MLEQQQPSYAVLCSAVGHLKGHLSENILLNRFLQPDNELLVSDINKKNVSHGLRFRDKACGKPV